MALGVELPPRLLAVVEAGRRGVAGGLLLALASVSQAQAQLIDQFRNPDIPGLAVEPGVTVLSRLRPDYDYRAVRVGSFIIRPEANVITGYDDNVLGTSRARGSTLEQTRATLQATSDWSRNSVALGLAVDDTRYFDQPRQSLTNWTASLGGTYEIGRDVVAVDYVHQNLNQTPRDLDTPQLDQSLPFRIDSVRVAYQTAFNRLSVRPEVQVAEYSFDNGTVAGQPYLQNYRDRTVVTPGVVVGYELSPRRNLVGVVRNAVASYRAPQAGATLRDFNDTAVLGGIDYDGGGPWRYRALAGYEVRTFSSSALKTIQAPVAELTVIYNPTGLTTVTGTLARRIADSADDTTTGFTETSAKLSIDHEYLRNVLLRAQGAVALDDFSRGQGSQTLYTIGAGATWLVNRNARLAATYDFQSRQSNTNGTLGPSPVLGGGQRFGGSYTESRYLLRLTFGL